MGLSITETLRVQSLERQVAEQADRIEALETQVHQLGGRDGNVASASVGAPEIAQLAERVQRLEAQIAGTQHTRGAPKRLREINASRQTRCNGLREAIASIVAAHPHPESITAKEAEQALTRAGIAPMPRPRTVRLRLAEALAEMATHGNTGDCQKRP